MSTRSRIGRQNDNGTVTSIYCHFDGYVDGVGAMLAELYQDSAKVDALLALGNISVLAEEIGEPHDFDWTREYYALSKDGWAARDADPRARMCLAYGRDRGEPQQDARTDPDARTFWARRRDSWAEFQYLFVNGGWVVQRGGSAPVALDIAMRALKAEPAE